jgi:hypothetical protein
MPNDRTTQRQSFIGLRVGKNVKQTWSTSLSASPFLMVMMQADTQYLPMAGSTWW